MNKSDLRNLIKSTIEEILKERTINVTDKKDVPKDLEDSDVVNIGVSDDDVLNMAKRTADKLQNVGDKFKSKPVKMTKDFYS